MKSQWQQFQRQQQQQQQQRRRMEQGAAWIEQQKRQQGMAAQAGQAAQQKVDQRFSQAEQEASRLRQQFAAGKLTQEALDSKLHELMIQDATGTWWMVGTESGRWYRYDGKNWVPGVPAGRGSAGAIAQPRYSPSPSSSGSMGKAVITFIFGLILSIAAFFAAGAGSYNLIRDFDYDLAEPASYLIAGIAGLIGLILTFRKAQQAARG